MIEDNYWSPGSKMHPVSAHNNYAQNRSAHPVQRHPIAGVRRRSPSQPPRREGTTVASPCRDADCSILRTWFQPMCGTLVVSLCVMHAAGEADLLAAQNPQSGNIALIAVLEQHFIDTDAKRACCAASRTASRNPHASSSRMQSGIAPCPGNTTRLAFAITSALSLTAISAPGATLRRACCTERKLPIP